MHKDITQRLSNRHTMADGDDTTIRIKTNTWRELNSRKQGPNDSFDDVIQRLLREDESDDVG